MQHKNTHKLASPFRPTEEAALAAFVVDVGWIVGPIACFEMYVE